MERTILLADMNSFYASCHQAVNPNLIGKEVIVAGDTQKRHGIVLAASYEAKKYGIKTGMPNWEAKSLCPQAVFLNPDFNLYIETSVKIVNLMREFTDKVEPFSIDEAFMDVTGVKRLFGDGITIAHKIKDRIKKETGVVCSIGIGPNKLLAKMAAGLQKPDGLTLLTREDIPDKLWPLPVEELFGVGPRIGKRLRDIKIDTIGKLANADVSKLKKLFGIIGEVLWASANGIDNSPVDPNSLDEMKSVGHQITLPRDYYLKNEINTILLELSDEVCARARKKGYEGKTVGLSVKGNDFRGIYRTKSMLLYSNCTMDIYKTVLELFSTHWSQRAPVRLLGVTLSKLRKIDYIQLEVFTGKEKTMRLENTFDRLREKYGTRSLVRAISLTEGSIYGPGKQTLGRTQNDTAGVSHPSFGVD